MEAQIKYLCRGQARDRVVLACAGVHQIELVDAVLIGSKGQRLAVIAESELIDIPLDIRGEIDRLHRSEVNIGEPLELRFSIGGGVEAFAIFIEGTAAIGDLFG